MIQLFSILVLMSFWLFAGCTSTPKPSQERVDLDQAKSFLNQYCSKAGVANELTPISGDLLVRSNAKEFKGQFPASIRFSKKDGFILEVTHLLGGTVAILKGTAEEMEVISVSRPKFNRKGVKRYLGLPVKLLFQLLHGDLPCPDAATIQVDGSKIIIVDGVYRWVMERSDDSSGKVPLRVSLFEGPTLQIDLLIENWDQKAGYAEKVKISTPEGDLKWTWRSRSLE